MADTSATILRLPSRPKRLAIHVVAPIVGVEPAHIRQWIFKGWIGKEVGGERKGRERLLDVGEVFLLRMVREFSTSSQNMRRAWERAVGLSRDLTPRAKADPPMPVDLYAVEQ